MRWWRRYRPSEKMVHRRDRKAFHHRVVWALRDCIKAHGPIDRQWTGSAAKRIVKAIYSGSWLSGAMKMEMDSLFERCGALKNENKRLRYKNNKLHRQIQGFVARDEYHGAAEELRRRLAAKSEECENLRLELHRKRVREMTEQTP